MFDAWTRRAIEAMGRAGGAARQYGHDDVEPAHLLLGILEVKGRAVSVLWDLGVDPAQIRTAIERRGRFPSRDQTIPSGGSITYSAETKNVLEIASETVAALGSPWAGTEHLLLAVIEANDDIASRVLKDESVTVERVRDRLAGGRDEGGADADPASLRGKRSPVPGGEPRPHPAARASVPRRKLPGRVPTSP